MYAVLGLLVAALCAVAAKTAATGSASEGRAPPPADADEFVFRIVRGFYRHPDWCAPPAGDEKRALEDRLTRLAAKGQATEEVIAGRRSLLDAAAEFRRWDALPPRQTPETGPLEIAGDGPEERYCRCVIWWVHYQAPPERADELTRRLEDELDARLKDGSLRLPAPAAE
jgi:hypothetical protein